VPFLLDTRVFLWSLGGRDRLSAETLQLLASRSNQLYLSAASSWEIAIKYQLGKIRLPAPPKEFIPIAIKDLGLIALDVTHRHSVAVGELPFHHRDPFDRLLIAQAQVESLAILTTDGDFRRYDVGIIHCGRR
jgi:PIN domain nuclease of toxin-antitoxin system